LEVFNVIPRKGCKHRSFLDIVLFSESSHRILVDVKLKIVLWSQNTLEIEETLQDRKRLLI
jgi:hypothetical protein